MPKASVERLYQDYADHRGDLTELYVAVVALRPVQQALYPGSYVDLAPSFVIPNVTYVDMDKRASKMFQDVEGVQRLIATRKRYVVDPIVTFLHADYTHEFCEQDDHFDLSISLYTGPLLDACTRYLRQGGLFLANNSHGDASLAALDNRYRLLAAVVSPSDGRYQVVTNDLSRYLVPKRPDAFTAEAIRSSGRGVAFSTTASAYVFERIS